MPLVYINMYRWPTIDPCKLRIRALEFSWRPAKHAHAVYAWTGAGGQARTTQGGGSYTSGMTRRLLTAALVLATSVLAQAPTRVYEMRTYTCFEGKLPDLLKRFREHTIEIFNRHHMESVGYWIPQDDRQKTTLIYILAHPSREAARQNWREFSADPEWKKVSADSEANGKIVQHVDSVFMDPTDFSKLK